MPKIKALVVVAHADDETMWMGGTLIRLKEKYDWTICCVTQNEKTKAGKIFIDVCKKIYRAKPVLLNCPSLRKQEVTKELAKFNHKVVFTHSAMGEAGHHKHIKLHNIVKAMGFEKFITFWPYEDDRKKLADISINLTKADRGLKLEIIRRYPLRHSDFKKVTKIIENKNTERFLIPKRKKNLMLYKFYTTQ